MKFLIQVLFIGGICLALQYFLPWWTMAIGTFISGYLFEEKGFRSFLMGFVSVGLLWMGMALYIDYASSSILTDKINQLFPINVLILTPLIGGLVGGLSCLTGGLLKDKKKKPSPYR